MDQEILGKLESQELKEGGKDIQVTEENKEEYIRYDLLCSVGDVVQQSKWPVVILWCFPDSSVNVKWKLEKRTVWNDSVGDSFGFCDRAGEQTIQRVRRIFGFNWHHYRGPMGYT